MRTLGKLLLIMLGMALLTLGLLTFSYVGQLASLRKVADETPQPLALADLLAKGPGPNAHVQLNEFKFGTPVIEKKDGEWAGAWLPLVPNKQTKKRDAPVVLWAGRVSNEDELQEFMRQETVNVLCVSRLQEVSSLRVRPGKTFQAANPKADLLNATILTEPVFVLADGTVIGPDTLFDGRLPEFLGWGAFAGLIVGGVCLWKGFRSLQAEPRRGPVKELGRPVQPTAEAYAELARESELSLHPFSWQLVFVRAGLRGGYLVACAMGMALLITAVVQNFLSGNLLALTVCTGLVVLLFLLGIRWTFMSAGALLQRISGFAIYPSGIRWQQGRQTHSALWQDIAEVYRTELRCFRRGEMNNTFSTMTLKLYDGQTLKLSADTYAYFEAFVENVLTTHGGWMAAVKRHELEEHGQAAFGPIVLHDDGVTLHGNFYGWENLERFEVENGHLNFFHTGAMFFSKTSIPFSAIPNGAALMSLLADMQNVIRGRRRVTV